MIHDIQSAQISQKQDERNIYAIMKTIYPTEYHEHYGQHSHNKIDDWQFTLTEQCETHQQLKEKESF